MPRNADELLARLSARDQKEVRSRVAATLEKMALHELRRARRKTQVAVAAEMQVAQSEISKIEQRSELRLGTLQEYIQALGGRLEMRAIFPEGAVELQVTGK
jgi:hypothetical protein